MKNLFRSVLVTLPLIASCSSNGVGADAVGVNTSFDARVLDADIPLPDATPPSMCGDGIVNGSEQCDGEVDCSDVCTWLFPNTQEAYVKASNAHEGNLFGTSIALSADGLTMAIGAPFEIGNATGINGTQTQDGNVAATNSGAVYIYLRNGASWSQQAYLKSSESHNGALGFGTSVALSADGTTLAVGATGENSKASGVGGDQTDNSLPDAGAVFVFHRAATTWSQEAYVKASNPATENFFGNAVALSNDGNTMVIACYAESSNATGINGDQSNSLAIDSGAAYVFSRDGSTWSQQAYVKASNTRTKAYFASSIGLSGDGNTMVVGAPDDASDATGVDGSQADTTAPESGAAYVFSRSGTTWSQQSYLKASNTHIYSLFGSALAISNDGNTIASGAGDESSDGSGVDGSQVVGGANSRAFSGAAYVFSRTNSSWQQLEYIKASNPTSAAAFGTALAISADGRVLVISSQDSSDATGIGGSQTDTSASGSGAAYVFTRDGSATTWTQREFVKASNTLLGNQFGNALALSSNGAIMAVGSLNEPSNATGINGDETNHDGGFAGAAYVFGYQP